MPKWFTNISQRFRRSRQAHDSTESLSESSQPSSEAVSTEVVQTEPVSDRRSFHADRTLGDVCANGSTPEIKKECGLPLHYASHTNPPGKENDNRPSFAEPPSLDPNITNISAPSIDEKTVTASKPTGKCSTKRPRGFRRWFGMTKLKCMMPKKTDTVNAQSEKHVEAKQLLKEIQESKTNAPVNSERVEKTEVQKRSKKKRKRKKKQRTKTKDCLASDSQISSQVTASGVLDPVCRELSDVCESKKLSDEEDTTVGMVVPNTPQLRQSLMGLKQDLLMSSQGPVEQRKQPRPSAKQLSPRIHQDSQTAGTLTVEPNVGVQTPGMVQLTTLDDIDKKTQQKDSKLVETLNIKQNREVETKLPMHPTTKSVKDQVSQQHDSQFRTNNTLRRLEEVPNPLVGQTVAKIMKDQKLQYSTPSDQIRDIDTSTTEVHFLQPTPPNAPSPMAPRISNSPIEQPVTKIKKDQKSQYSAPSNEIFDIGTSTTETHFLQPTPPYAPAPMAPRISNSPVDQSVTNTKNDQKSQYSAPSNEIIYTGTTTNEARFPQRTPPNTSALTAPRISNSLIEQPVTTITKDQKSQYSATSNEIIDIGTATNETHFLQPTPFSAPAPTASRISNRRIEQPVTKIRKDQESQYSTPSNEVIDTGTATNATHFVQLTPPTAPAPTAPRISNKPAKSMKQVGDGASSSSNLKHMVQELPAVQSETDSSQILAEVRFKSGLANKPSKTRKTKRIKKFSASLSIGEKMHSSSASKQSKNKRSKAIKNTDVSDSSYQSEDRAHPPLRFTTTSTTSENSLTDSRNSSWCRRICDQDKQLKRRKARRATDHQSVLPRSRSLRDSRNCRCPTTIPSSLLARSPNQCVNILVCQADTMIEELIDKLAWDMADAIVARSSYARTLSSRSKTNPMLLLRALASHSRQSSADGSVASYLFPQCSRRSTPLVD